MTLKTRKLDLLELLASNGHHEFNYAWSDYISLYVYAFYISFLSNNLQENDGALLIINVLQKIECFVYSYNDCSKKF